MSKYSHINFRPSESMISAAKAAQARRRELSKRRSTGLGMTATGIARMRDIANGAELSPDTWRTMNAWFARHTETSRNSPNYSKREAAWVAWNGWGGDSGRARAKKIVAQMDAADRKSSGQTKEATCVITKATTTRFSCMTCAHYSELYCMVHDIHPSPVQFCESFDPK